MVKKGFEPLTYGLEDHCSNPTELLDLMKTSAVFTDGRSTNELKFYSQITSILSLTDNAKIHVNNIT